MSEAPVALRFSHVGLFVTDRDVVVAFYRGVLGFIVTDQGRHGEAALTLLSRDAREHHQIVLVEGRPAALPDRIVNQLSFRVETLGELLAFWRRIRDAAPRELVPVTHDNAWSIYFRDPEGNRVEIFADTPWHVTQPERETIDLDRTRAEIVAETEAFCRGRPGFRPKAAWRRGVPTQRRSERDGHRRHC
jgi:catechol 2,3-dioxygenase